MLGRIEHLVRTVEGVAYWLVTAPLLAWLPARLGYGLAVRRGDWDYRYRRIKRALVMRHLETVLGSMPSNRLAGITREYFRQQSCEAVDIMRPASGWRALSRLVEVRGLDHLREALAGGRGAIICGAHFGSYNSCFSLLHAYGFPVTTIGRWQYKYTARLSSMERKFWRYSYERRIIKQRARPNIEPWTGRVSAAVEAAAILRANEVVTICVDAPPLPSDQGRTVTVEMFGRPVALLPGIVTLAQCTGAPVLTAFLYRDPNHRNQVLEISAPLALDPRAVEALSQCASGIEAAIRRQPSQWVYWASSQDLVDLGLLRQEAAAGIEQPAKGGFEHEHSG